MSALQVLDDNSVVINHYTVSVHTVKPKQLKVHPKNKKCNPDLLMELWPASEVQLEET